MAVGVDVSRQNGVGRRAWLQGGLALGAAALAGWPGREVLASHGMAWGGEPRYPESFAHFDYVRPDAPRGGLVRLAGMGTFDSLNPFTLRGIAADGAGTLMFESLAVASWDEPFSVYGLLAEDMILAEDRLSVMFKRQWLPVSCKGTTKWRVKTGTLCGCRKDPVTLHAWFPKDRPTPTIEGRGPRGISPPRHPGRWSSLRPRR